MLNLIGNTPIVKIETGIEHINLYAKCEFMNPTGSIKDRVAKYIFEHLKTKNSLKKTKLIVEASSGNMGTSLAALSKFYGYKVHITCPEKTGLLKRNMIKEFGADLTICPSVTDTSDPNFYVNTARKIAIDNNGYFINQYDNFLNVDCHYDTTGQEIIDYFDEKEMGLDYFITVGGSGGTITGCAKKIRSRFPHVQVVMPDPCGSVYYDLFYHNKVIEKNIYGYKVEGPGNPVYCKSMDLSLLDQVIRFTDNDAFQACRELSKEHGILGGHSSGANYFVYKKLLSFIDLKRKQNILIIIPDNGIKYLL